MPTFSLTTSLKSKLGAGGSGKADSPVDSPPPRRVSFGDNVDYQQAVAEAAKQADADAELRASPACRRVSTVGAHELEEGEEEEAESPSLDNVFSRRGMYQLRNTATPP